MFIIFLISNFLISNKVKNTCLFHRLPLKAMFKNYFLLHLRRLWKMRAYAGINIGGMAVAVTGCFFLVGHILHEAQFDQYHEKADRIVRLNVGNLHTDRRSAVSSGAMAPAFADDYPEIENYVRFRQISSLVEKGERQFYEDGFYYTDSTVFEVFDFALREGDPNTALKQPFSIVLTAAAAEKYFGDGAAMGQSLEIDNRFTFQVTGILEEVPDNSHFRFDFLASVSSLRQHPDESVRYWSLNSWYSHYYHTYLLLRPVADVAALGHKIERIAEQYSNPEYFELYGREMGLYLQPLTDIHLQPVRGEMEAQGNAKDLYIFGAVALILLLIACFNYANLATALTLERHREIGVRKVLGAGTRQLSFSFFGESFLVSGLGFLVALALLQLAAPLWEQLTGYAFAFKLEMLPFALLTLLLLGFLGGAYPALVGRSFHPASIFKNDAGKIKGFSVNKGLVVFQFALSLGLIVATLVVSEQLRYMRNQPLGLDMEQVVVLPTRGNPTVTQRFASFERELKKSPDVTLSTISELVPGQQIFGFTCRFEGMEAGRDFSSVPVGYDFFATYSMTFAAGRTFSRNIPTDTLERAIINEALARELGWTDPQEAIGKRYDFANDGENIGEVIGVVKDAHFSSLRNDIRPLLFLMDDHFNRHISLRLRTADLPSTLATIERIWQQFFPDLPFEYFFADEHFGRQYTADQRLANILAYFVGIAILLACVGLFGLSAFTVRRRFREIGIRKVLGATTASIVQLLSADFLKLVLVAILIAIPVSYHFMNQWLQDFAFRITVPWWVFGLAGAALIGVAFLTVSLQSVNAAYANPVDSLRSE